MHNNGFCHLLFADHFTLINTNGSLLIMPKAFNAIFFEFESFPMPNQRKTLLASPGIGHAVARFCLLRKIVATIIVVKQSPGCTKVCLFLFIFVIVQDFCQNFFLCFSDRIKKCAKERRVQWRKKNTLLFVHLIRFHFFHRYHLHHHYFYYPFSS